MDELTKIALVGTSKHTGPLPATDHPAATLVAGLANDDRERSLLLRWGARAVYDLAGQRPVSNIEPIAPALPEANRIASRKLADLLRTAVAADGNELLIDCLRQMQGRLVVLPPEVLPVMLESKDLGVRRCVIPILGERGRWLCRQNPDWSSFLTAGVSQGPVDVEALKQTWDNGTIDERCQALKTLRCHDPSTARGWVAGVFAKEKANHRARIVECFETGLCDDDEPFLESCLNDRSTAVGQAAARLLYRLPKSALAGRMRGRAASILGSATSGFILKKNKLVCTPPQEIDREWERDGISKAAPAGQGERAFWTERVFAAVPPSYWHHQLGLEPQALIAGVADDPFGASVIAGWTEAAVAFAGRDQESADWLAPLWRHAAHAVKGLQGRDRMSAIERMRPLLPRMTPDLAEAEVEGLFEPGSGWEDAEALRFVLELPAPWSARFSRAFLASVRRRVQNRADQAALTWANVLARRSCAIAPEAFPVALAPWEVAAPAEPATWFAAKIQGEINTFITTIEMRQSFITELYA